jgi:FKBP-type peptidyl-prolyl cis-trans isomerase
MYLKNLAPFTFFQILAFSCVVLLAASCKEDEDPDAQIKAEVAAIDAFLETDGSESTLYDQTGIRMVIHQIGDNPPPATGQTVKFDYSLKLFSTGVVVESGTMNDKLENMPTDGLRYSLASMLGNSIATFYVPSKFGYGDAGKTGVPANSTLVYEIISRIEVSKTSAQQTQFNADTAVIRQYISTNNIKNAVKLSAGVWYTIDATGTGRYPTPYDAVVFQYKGTIMSNGSVFEESTSSGLTPFGLIDGLKVGMPRMQEGGTATFYIPSGLGYGTTGITGKIPQNANLIFRIQLNSVTPYFQ